MLSPTIITLGPKKLIGMKRSMSLVDNKTVQLFQQFMPRRKEITQVVNMHTYELCIYPADYFIRFDPNKLFEKWTMLAVDEYEDIPEGMETLDLPGGEYAQFIYKGLGSDKSIYEYIYTKWIPASDYEMDLRPHFNVLTEKTKLNDPNSEEEIWIPIKMKK